jgi:hypothetical protein
MTPENQSATRIAYTPPTIQVMSDEDILKNFQVTSAQGGWWVGIGVPGSV